MNEPSKKKVLLAEDDEDDFILFREALNECKDTIQLDWVRDGEKLMDILKAGNGLPDMIFLDINMPRKNGFECLTEIRQSDNLKQLPVIIYSTSSDRGVIRWMYNTGANLYINKVADFKTLKEYIRKAIAMDWKTRTPRSSVEDFLLN